ncbi:ScyD/ScyE family protein [Pseudarthrobacter sulfonivorans]|uniref:ScyD/ScyE family protein n=1 Tax=Pseudarthrobacter sulfonivorans TaxID=121292 RepID=UPI0021048125|nr:ScyD/ScyE family protein [Pseudarthrobacter sulfonivorans]
MKKKFPLAACLAAAALIISIGPAAAGSPPEPETLATGLLAPLSLAVDRNDSVLVTQNFAGRLDRVKDDGQLANLYTHVGWDVAGVQTRGGTTYFLESMGAGGGHPDALHGYVKSIDRRGDVQTIADLASYERANNPDGDQQYGFGAEVSDECLKAWPAFPPGRYEGIVDSHPYATAVEGDTLYVADAGANAILAVDTATGDISTVAVLPARPAVIPAGTRIPIDMAGGTAEVPACVAGHEYAFESVPTDVEIGPDGWLYVSSLPGGPEDPSFGARGAIFKVNPWTGATRLWADDILSPTGIAVADNGDVYAASMFGNEIVRIDARDREQSQFLAVNGPAAVELSGDTLYATAGFGPGAPAGTVIKASIR